MKFHEKLRRRVEELGLNKSKAARDVGLPESTISNYLIKEDSLPRIDIAAKIAKAIKVPLLWLADDEANWPPPEEIEDANASLLSDEVLMLEVAKRQRLSILRLLSALEKAEKIDWKTACSQFSNAELLGIVFPIRYMGEMIGRFDPAFMALVHHRAMPGKEFNTDHFQQKPIVNRALKLLHNPDFLSVLGALLHLMPEGGVEKIEGDLLWDRSGEFYKSMPATSPLPKSFDELRELANQESARMPPPPDRKTRTRSRRSPES